MTPSQVPPTITGPLSCADWNYPLFGDDADVILVFFHALCLARASDSVFSSKWVGLVGTKLLGHAVTPGFDGNVKKQYACFGLAMELTCFTSYTGIQDTGLTSEFFTGCAGPQPAVLKQLLRQLGCLPKMKGCKARSHVLAFTKSICKLLKWSHYNWPKEVWVGSFGVRASSALWFAPLLCARV